MARGLPLPRRRSVGDPTDFATLREVDAFYDGEVHVVEARVWPPQPLRCHRLDRLIGFGGVAAAVMELSA